MPLKGITSFVFLLIRWELQYRERYPHNHIINKKSRSLLYKKLIVGMLLRNSRGLKGTASRYHHIYIFYQRGEDIPLKGIPPFICFNKEVGDMKGSKKHKGFTLTELLIVLLIMAILAAIAIPNYTAFLNKIKEMAGW
jgi:prepilin-type N-terminal cleavage/methylation domain-containing protein